MKKAYSIPTVGFLDYYVSEQICCETSKPDNGCNPGCTPIHNQHDWNKWVDFWRMWNKRSWHWPW